MNATEITLNGIRIDIENVQKALVDLEHKIESLEKAKEMQQKKIYKVQHQTEINTLNVNNTTKVLDKLSDSFTNQTESINKLTEMIYSEKVERLQKDNDQDIRALEVIGTQPQEVDNQPSETNRFDVIKAIIVSPWFPTVIATILCGISAWFGLNGVEPIEIINK